jgi:hypothetical protein
MRYRVPIPVRIYGQGYCMNPLSSFLQRILLSVAVIALGFSAAGAMAVTLEPLPETVEPAIAIPKTVKGTNEITQIREQNAVTSVRVKRGNSAYYITPSEQFSESQSGGRAAQWQIFEFKSKSAPSDTAPPPPQR